MKSISQLIEPFSLHRLTTSWIEKAVSSSFDPELAKVNFERFLEMAIEVDPGLLQRLNKRNISWISLLFSGSQVLTDLAMKDPGNLFWALQPSVLHSTRFKAEMRRERELTIKKSEVSPAEALCRFKNRELMRIGWRDLLKWADTVETLEDLSRLADVSIEGALRLAETEMIEKYGRPIKKDGKPAKFIVLGLGKLGGRELNFSSDIDLIYMFDDDNGETEGGRSSKFIERPKIAISEYFTKIAQRLTSILNDIGPSGNIYRVDLNLRPEGSRGALVISLSAAELYYESWGQPWERQMLIKARVVAGDANLGDRFINAIRPFVFRKFLDFSHLKEIHQMKEKIDKHLTTGKDRYKNNVKLGKGGIREIEFVIQTYQLIYGGKMPWLAETNSLKAIHRIFERGLLGNLQYAQLADGLVFLRDLENRMQITYGRQVQILPDKEKDLQTLALKMNLDDSKALLREYEQVTENVHAIFDEFFKEDTDEEVFAAEEYQIDLESEEEGVAQLAEMKFENPKAVFDSLLHIRDGEPFNHPSSKSRRMFMRLLPSLMELIVSFPEKDRIVSNLDKFVSSRVERESIYEILLELPSSREVLITLFSMAQSLTDLIINMPAVVDLLADGIRQDAKHSLKDIPEIIDSYDARLDWARKQKNAESLRIGIKYLFGNSDLFQIMEELSTLAEEFVEACLQIILKEVKAHEEHETVIEPKLAVIGMGKLGRRELNYGSDLDIMFVYPEEDGAGNADLNGFYTNICRKLLNAIGGISQSGYAYKVDTRLRPEGEKGSIVISEETALKYYEKRGALWERMALCGARAVAGDKVFGGKFIKKLESFVYEGKLSEKDISDISAMKRVIEREKIKSFKKTPIKYGKGGIVDIEFFAQKIQLQYGWENSDLRGLNTFKTLEKSALEGFGRIDKSGINDIIKSYEFLRGVETHMRMEAGRSAESLPQKTEELRLLENKIGRYVKLNGSLIDSVHESMERVKKSLVKTVRH